MRTANTLIRLGGYFDQTGQMPRLIFTGHTGHFVGFVTLEFHHQVNCWVSQGEWCLTAIKMDEVFSLHQTFKVDSLACILLHREYHLLKSHIHVHSLHRSVFLRPGCKFAPGSKFAPCYVWFKCQESMFIWRIKWHKLLSYFWLPLGKAVWLVIWLGEGCKILLA